MLLMQAEVEERRERQERQEKLEKKKKKDDELRRKEEAEKVSLLSNCNSDFLCVYVYVQRLEVV